MRTFSKFSIVYWLTYLTILFSCKKDLASKEYPNQPPIANAGVDQTISLPEDTVILNGSGSTDPDFNITYYKWTEISGPNSVTINTARAVQTLVTNLIEGIYQFELTVTDDELLYSKDRVQVTIVVNKPPVAIAGPDIIITQSPCASLQLIGLDGSSSFDPDDGILDFQWNKIEGPGQGGIAYNNRSYALVNIVAGLYSFELIVKDSKGLSSRDTMVVDAYHWLLLPYDLNISLNGAYHFYDHVMDVDDENNFIDITEMDAMGTFDPIGQFTLIGLEWVDNKSLGNNQFSSFRLSVEKDNTTLQIPYILGKCSIFFKPIIKEGGGSFNGTFKLIDGTAWHCNHEIYENLVPLTVTGNLDTNSHQINLTIKGRIYL